jgi:hypothetical protein
MARRGARFTNGEELGQAIEALIAADNPNAKSREWRKRAVNGAQLPPTLVHPGHDVRVVRRPPWGTRRGRE